MAFWLTCLACHSVASWSALGAEPSSGVRDAFIRATELTKQAIALQQSGRWREALAPYETARQVLTEGLGPDSRAADVARLQVADCLVVLGRYSEARPLLETCLAHRATTLGNQHPDVAEISNRLGETYRLNGELEASRPYYRRAQDILSGLPDQKVTYAVALSNEALVLCDLGHYREAEQTWTRALALLAERPDPLRRAQIVTNLGELHRFLGLFTQASAEHQEAYALLRDVSQTHRTMLLTHNNYASLLRSTQRSREAIPLYERCLAQYALQRDHHDLEVLKIQMNLARAFAEVDDHARALTIIDQSLESLRLTQRTAYPLFDTLRVDQADSRRSLGDLAGAEALYRDVYASVTNRFGMHHGLALGIRERLIVSARLRGGFGEAREMLDSLLQQRRELARLDPQQEVGIAETLQSGAVFFRELGRLDLAMSWLGEAIEIRTHRTLSTDPRLAEALEETALIQCLSDRSEEAIATLQRVRQIRTHTYGETSSPVAKSLLYLAEAYLRLSRFELAHTAIQDALAITKSLSMADTLLGAKAAYLAGVMLQSRGDMENAALVLQSAFQIFHRERSSQVALVARELASVQWALGRHDSGVALAKSAMDSVWEQWRNMTRFSSEQDRLGWQGSRDLFSAAARVASFDPQPLADAVIRLKGAVIDSLIEDAQLSRPSDGSAPAIEVLALRQARQERYRLSLAQNSSRPPSTESLRLAIDRVDKLEAGLSVRMHALGANRNASQASWEEVAKRLLPGEALLEFVRFDRSPRGAGSHPFFGVLVIRKETKPVWVELGPANAEGQITSAIRKLQTNMHSDPPPLGAVGLEPFAHLYESLWKPIEPALGEVHTVLLAPDGELNFVPFAGLWKHDHFLAETLNFRYVASGRDLLQPDYEHPKEKVACVFASPQHSRSLLQRKVVGPALQAWDATLGILALRGSSNSVLPGSYSDLEGARIEGQSISRLALKHGCSSAQVFEGAHATEAALRSVQSPFFLHIASHGTVLPDSLSATPRSVVEGTSPCIPHHPMHRSWLALARANETLDSWRTGELPDPLDDGILTADEAGTLSLDHTWLVTLSACDTGLGLGRNGEGVLGLRRGFALAGARHVLTTLWPVQDDRTKTFMEAFYDDALATNDAPSALNRTQRKFLREWRSPEGGTTAQAVRWAGAFVITSRGR